MSLERMKHHRADFEAAAAELETIADKLGKRAVQAAVFVDEANAEGSAEKVADAEVKYTAASIAASAAHIAAESAAEAARQLDRAISFIETV